MKQKNNYKLNKIREGRFMVASAAAKASGDTACACSLPDGRLAFILSDGMGKGMKAAAESQVVVTELRRLLKKGIAPSRAIKLVNKTLINENQQTEIFATLDLMIIDKDTGFAHFYKMGAVSSFLVRDQKVKRIEHPALPVGIIGKVKACQTKVKLKQGDTVIMVSDGITEADRGDLDARWLLGFLTESQDDFGPRVMAERIVQLAQTRYDCRQKDDLTAVVIKIS